MNAIFMNQWITRSEPWTVNTQELKTGFPVPDYLKAKVNM